jgi:hypothetical protein
MRRSLFAFAMAALSALVLNAPVFAQQGSVVRGVIQAISDDGATLTVKARSGDTVMVHMKPETTVALIIPATLADVKPDAYIGVTAVPGPDGELQAMEVHVFPPAARGAGEGSHPFDLAPGSSMTNGNLGTRVDEVKGPLLTVTYNGGQKVIRLLPTTPIVTFEQGARSDLKVGAAMIARGPKGPDGVIEAPRVQVGKDGLVPPM